MSLDDLNNLTGEETPEELEKLLNDIESDEITVVDDDFPDEPQEKAVETNKPEVDNPEASAPSDGEKESTVAEEPTEPVLLAKDGENTIPFNVLESEREKNAQLQKELDALKARESEMSDKDRLLEIRNKQLEDLGVQPRDLPENFEVSEEKLDELSDDYPDIGPLIRGLVAKVRKFETPTSQPEQQEQQNPAAVAVAENSDLSSWQKEGGELWNKALEVDEQLMNSPEWANRPLSERFAKVVEIVKGNQAPATDPQAKKVQDKAKQEEEQLADSLPASPSEVGQTSTGQKTKENIITSGSYEDIENLFSGMSPEQIEASLSELDI